MSINTLRNVYRNGPVEVNLVEIVDPSDNGRDERYEYSCSTCPSARFFGHVPQDDEEGVVHDAEIHFELFHTPGVKTLTEDTFLTFYADVVRDWPAAETVEAERLTRRWLERGDGVAFYQNHDLGHPEAGDYQITSYGGRAAQIEVDDPPERLPDIGKKINWRYTLVAKYRRTN